MILTGETMSCIPSITISFSSSSNRRKALYNDKIRERLKEIFCNLAPTVGIEITGMEPAQDHIHMLVKGTPSTDLEKVFNTLKGVLAGTYGRSFRRSRTCCGGNPSGPTSKFIATTGQVLLEVLMKYVESQNEPKVKK